MYRALPLFLVTSVTVIPRSVNMQVTSYYIKHASSTHTSRMLPSMNIYIHIQTYIYIYIII